MRQDASRGVLGLVAIAAPPALFVVFTLGTYRPAAHGPADEFTRGVVYMAGACIVVYGALRWLSASTHALRLPLLASALLLGGFALAHTARVLHPVRRGAPFIWTEDRFPNPRLEPARWDVSADSVGAEVTAAVGSVRLSARPGARASMELKPQPEAWWTRSPAAWFLPVRFDTKRFGEQLEWRATVVRARTFFVVLETRDLLLQLAPYGAHVTVRSSGSTSAAELQVPALNDGAEHTWRIRWVAGLTTLDVDGSRLWERGETAPLSAPRFGETRSDDLHGGEIRLSRVSYQRWWQLPLVNTGL